MLALPDYALGRLAVAVLRGAAFDARRGRGADYFESDDYLFWLDVVNVFWGVNIDASAITRRQQATIKE